MTMDANYLKITAFRNEFTYFYGSAAKAAVDCIADKIMR